jgi:hypothetical protein
MELYYLETPLSGKQEMEISEKSRPKKKLPPPIPIPEAALQPGERRGEAAREGKLRKIKF